VVLDPLALIEESQAIEKAMSISLRDRLVVSNRCHLILPYHRVLETAIEKTTRRTTNRYDNRAESVPRTKDKMGRRGLRVCDLLDPETLPQKIGALVAEKNRELEALKYPQSIEPGPICDSYTLFGEKIKGFVCDTSVLLKRNDPRRQTRPVRGASGDAPRCGSRHVPLCHVLERCRRRRCPGLGISPKHVHRVIGISKAYTTRVGGGPFPTESDDGPGGHGEQLRTRGNEYGSTTGRPRVAAGSTVRQSGIRR